MRNAETVTFGGTGFDRAAQLRGTPAGDDPGGESVANVLPFWRGRPLLSLTEGGGELGLLPPGHAVLEGAGAPVFLGLSGGVRIFAAGIADWSAEVDGSAGDGFDAVEVGHPALGPDEVFCDLRMAMARLSPRAAEVAVSAKGILEWHSGHGYCPGCGGPTDPAQSGWQRVCRACGRRHFPRTDPVVIMLITNGNNVLLGRAPHWPDRMYSLLAGFVEPGETVESAVRREVAEETGVEVGQVGYLSSQPWPFPASLMIGCWGLAKSEVITPDPAEIADARWISREELMAASTGQHAEIQPARPGAIAHFLLMRWLADGLR